MTLTLSTAYRLHPFSKVQGTFFEHGRFFQCILSGTSLSSALSSCGLGGEEDTEEEISRQVADLERELEDQREVNAQLKSYVGEVLVNIMLKNPQILERKA